MVLEQVLWSLQDNGLSHFLDEGRALTMVVQTFHILGFTLLLAVVLALTLRVQGWALTALPVERLSALLSKPYRWSLGVALAAGVLLFLPRAVAYGVKEVFLWKLAILAVAIGAHALVQRQARVVPVGAAAGAPLRSLALVSLFLWFTSAAAGRAIGFV
jgi:hypothetical protein